MISAIAVQSSGCSHVAFCERTAAPSVTTPEKAPASSPTSAMDASLSAPGENDPTTSVTWPFAATGAIALQLIADIRLIYDNYAYETEILVASVRHGIHVLEAAKIGADVMTAPPSVIKGLFKHVLTEKGIEGFLADWAKTGQSI